MENSNNSAQNQTTNPYEIVLPPAMVKQFHRVEQLRQLLDTNLDEELRVKAFSEWCELKISIVEDLYQLYLSEDPTIAS